jgi:hypothetical protein
VKRETKEAKEKKAETKNNHDREKLFAREKKKSKKRDKNSLFFTLDQLEVLVCFSSSTNTNTTNNNNNNKGV